MPGGHRRMPAIDALCLDKNEGADWAKPLNIMFTVSGDLENVVKTVVDLPESFSAPLRIVIHDESPISRRNFLLILMAISSKDPRVTAELAVNLWYNEYWPSGYAGALQRMIKSVERNLAGLSNLSGMTPEGLTNPAVFEPFFQQRRVYERRYGDNTLRFYLTERDCQEMLFVSGNEFNIIKDGANLESWRPKPWEEKKGPLRDNWDTLLMCLPPHWREPFCKYHHERVVLPFGSPRNGKCTLGLSEYARINPLESWDLREVLATDAGVPRNDLYGKLFFHVRGLFEKFIVRLQSLKVDFEIHLCKGADLPKQIAGIRFDRIVAPNLGHSSTMGLQRMLNTFSPLLKSPTDNPHATLIDVHSSIQQQITDFDSCSMCNPEHSMALRVTLTKPDRLKKFSEDVFLHLTPPIGPSFEEGMCSSRSWKRVLARMILENFDAAWDFYQKIHRFHAIAAETGVRMKANTVVELKPMALKLRGQDKGSDKANPESQAEFDAVFCFIPMSDCRYVEWQKSTIEMATRPTATTGGRHGPNCYED
ncbi:hypothetical protein LQW54_008950 [Pestalotiopsis sp. IQ-011]